MRRARRVRPAPTKISRATSRVTRALRLPLRRGSRRAAPTAHASLATPGQTAGRAWRARLASTRTAAAARIVRRARTMPRRPWPVSTLASAPACLALTARIFLPSGARRVRSGCTSKGPTTARAWRAATSRRHCRRPPSAKTAACACRGVFCRAARARGVRWGSTRKSFRMTCARLVPVARIRLTGVPPMRASASASTATPPRIT